MIKIPEELLKVASDAMYASLVKQAREKVAASSGVGSDLEDLVCRLLDETETAQILIFSAYLEDRIKAIMQLNLFHLESKGSQDRLFDFSGPLGTFSSRILIAHHLGWISSGCREQLDAFRSIRNRYAHHAFRVNREDQDIKAWWSTIGGDITPWYAAAPQFGEFYKQLYPKDDLPVLRRQLCQLVLMTGRVFRELLVHPVALTMQVGPSDMVGNFDDGPENIRTIARYVSECVLQCIVRDELRIADTDGVRRVPRGAKGAL